MGNYTPTWKTYEKDAHDQHDPEKALKASDAFEEEREKEMKNSPKARKWEADRKAAIASQKPQFVKERLEKEKREELKPFTDLKTGGIYPSMIQPMPGYVLIEVDKPEEKTSSGIVLPGSAEDPTTGRVVAVGQPIIQNGVEVYPNFKADQRIMFKKFAGSIGTAGLELNLQGKDYRLMRWSANTNDTDILGVFE